ncbi:MAG: polysialyltransferase family glycosyltransferase [Marinomonas sp.]
MYHFFNIESPLQLMSAISAAKKFGDKENVLLVNLSKGTRKNNDAQIMALIDYDFWSEVIVQKKSSGFIKDFVTAFRMLSLKKKYKGKVDKYFFGEYRNFNMALISGFIEPKERILLDDGSFTITAQNYFIKNNRFPYSNSLKNKLFKTFLTGNTRPNLYSFFKLELIDNQINYYDFPPRQFIAVNDKEAFFFGSKFSESKNMSLEDELEILKKTIELYSDYVFFYIPHRDEGRDKLERIMELGYSLKNLGKPAEIFFDETDVMPELVVSYYSTTLYTCYIRFENIKILSVNVEEKLLKTNSRISAGEIYNYYEALGIDTLSFKI